MMNYTMAQAKRDFQAGYIKGCNIDFIAGVWVIFIRANAGTGFLVDARTKENRTFKSLDSAMRSLSDIGFRVVSLHVV